MRNNRVEERFLSVERQIKTVFHHQLAAEIAQRKEDLPPADPQRQVVPGFRLHHQPDCRTATAARLLNFRLLNQVRFQHLADNLGNTGGCQLCQARKIDTRNRTKLINQAIHRASVGLLNLINMPWLTISDHLVLPYFRASK
ncbi:Uncharacterised protein [Klebsiella pneumoniae]|nr:Uncharacterised protein [Klebsiella pneumoniae]